MSFNPVSTVCGIGPYRTGQQPSLEVDFGRTNIGGDERLRPVGAGLQACERADGKVDVKWGGSSAGAQSGCTSVDLKVVRKD